MIGTGRHSAGKPFTPEGRCVAECTRGFVTREPDGLFYKWWTHEGRDFAWTYAFRTLRDALRKPPGRILWKKIEGVEYSAFVVRFRLADGRARRWIRWSPSVGVWVREELERELAARGLRPEHLKERSCTITRRAS